MVQLRYFVVGGWLAVMLVVAVGGCDTSGGGGLTAPESPYYLLLDGSKRIIFEDGERLIDVNSASVSDTQVATVTWDGDSITLVGVKEGEAQVEVDTEEGRVDFQVVVMEADRFELRRTNFPWAPLVWFVPGGKEWIDGAAWFKGKTELNGQPLEEPVYSTSDAAVAAVAMDPVDVILTISYLTPGTVTLLADGLPGPERTVVAVDGIESLGVWADCGGVDIDSSSNVTPIWVDCGTSTFFVTGRDADGHVVGLEGAQNLVVESKTADCQFSADSSTRFDLRRLTPGDCELLLTMGSVSSTVMVPFGSDPGN